MSPNASWAKWVIPTRTEPSASPGVRTHSCSAVYFRSSGYTALLLDASVSMVPWVVTRATAIPGRLPGGRLRSQGRRGSGGLCGVLRGGLVERGDVERLLLLD